VETGAKDGCEVFESGDWEENDGDLNFDLLPSLSHKAKFVQTSECLVDGVRAGDLENVEEVAVSLISSRSSSLIPHVWLVAAS
jgi:hypothetical protein